VVLLPNAEMGSISSDGLSMIVAVEGNAEIDSGRDLLVILSVKSEKSEL
jgi:hypothetical protein